MGEFPSKKNQFKKGQSGNPKGRAPKRLTAILKELKSKGYEAVNKQNVSEAYQLLLALNTEEITEIAADETQPMILQIVARELMGKNANFMLETMLDRSQGKATQKTEITGKDGKDLFSDMSDEELKKEIERLRKIQNITD